MTTSAACTIVARNYVAQARVLYESLRLQHPEMDFVTLVVDAEVDEDITGVGRVVRPEDLDVDREELHAMLAIYDVMELSTALKPALLTHLLRSGASAALYFDPDIKLFARVDDVIEAAREDGIVLTPHVLNPFPEDDRIVSERMVMLAGIFNLGFIGVSTSALRFLAWWNEKLSRHAISDPSRALFTDQRWIDWVPSLFPHRVLRDPGLNVAHWNLHERRLEPSDAGWLVNDVPLRFLHFSGYDPHQPWLLSKHTRANPRVLLSEDPHLQTLCDEYGAELLAADYEALRRTPYRFGTSANGLTIDHGIRRLVRSVDAGELVPRRPMPDPFDDGVAFSSWLLRPGLGDPLTPLTPLEVAVWLSRTDLQSAFPGALAEAGEAYHDWFVADPDAQGRLRHVLSTLPDRPEPTAPPRRSPSVSTAQWSIVIATVPGTDEHEVATRIAGALLRSGASTTLVDVIADDQDRIRWAEGIATPGVVVLIGADQALYSDLAIVLGRPDTVGLGVILGSGPAVSRSPLLHAGWRRIWAVGEPAAREITKAQGAPSVDAIAFPAFPLVETPPSAAAPDPDGRAVVLLEASAVDSLHRRAETVAVVIDAARAAQTPVRLSVVGDPLDPASEEHLRWLARDQDYVVLADPADETGAADVLVSTIAHPGLSLAVVRAQSDGVAVLAPDGPSKPWSIDDDSGCLVPETGEEMDHPRAVRALTTLLRSTTIRDRTARQARTEVARRFSMAAIAGEYRTLLEAFDGGDGS